MIKIGNFGNTFGWSHAIIMTVKTPPIHYIYFFTIPIVKIPSPKRAADRWLFFFVTVHTNKKLFTSKLDKSSYPAWICVNSTLFLFQICTSTGNYSIIGDNNLLLREIGSERR